MKQCQDWIGTDEHVLFCMSAPLGWPNRMRKILPKHTAGEFLGIMAKDLFNRDTDKFIEKRCHEPSDLSTARQEGWIWFSS